MAVEALARALGVDVRPPGEVAFWRELAIRRGRDDAGAAREALYKRQRDEAREAARLDRSEVERLRAECDRLARVHCKETT